VRDKRFVYTIRPSYFNIYLYQCFLVSEQVLRALFGEYLFSTSLLVQCRGHDGLEVDCVRPGFRALTSRMVVGLREEPET